MYNYAYMFQSRVLSLREVTLSHNFDNSDSYLNFINLVYCMGIYKEYYYYEISCLVFNLNDHEILDIIL